MAIVTVRNPSDYVLSTWSGGETQQLYLYPETGDYGKREFSYRLSTATVALRQTTFTSLEGYHRIIMTLDKPIRLSDLSEHRDLSLAPFEPYAFEGSSRIISHGTCRDINLMFNQYYTGDLQTIWSDVPFDFPEADIQMIYPLEELTLACDGQGEICLEANHLVIIERDSSVINVQIASSHDKENHYPLAVWAGLWQK